MTCCQFVLLSHMTRFIIDKYDSKCILQYLNEIILIIQHWRVKCVYSYF